MNTGEYEFLRSYSRPGESQVIFMARDSMHSRDVPELLYQVRKKVGDIRPSLPAEVIGPFFNDEFGDTFGNIYALTGDGFDYAVMRDYADRIQLELQRVADVGKVDLLGLQDEKIWIELSNTKLATLGRVAATGAAGACRAERDERDEFLRDRRPIACSFVWAGSSRAWTISASSRSVPATARSIWAISPRSGAGLPIRRHRRCGSSARMRSALRWR